jgi:outer membrane protein OmpA-like peptidoglycan-associated protein
LVSAFSILMLLNCPAILFAAELPVSASQTLPETQPVWWFGVAGAANLNFYGGTLQQLNSSLMTPVAFHKGYGIGLYLAPEVEYRPDSVWGGILQVGYDGRRGTFNDVTCPCGEKAGLSAKPAYLSIEPSLRVAPFAGDFYLFAGPRVGFLWSPAGEEKTFHYTPQGSPATNAKFSDMREVVFSGQIGLGYDFEWAPENSRNRFEFSPFVSYQPPYGEEPRSIDHWGLETVRVGAMLKFGRVSAPPEEAKVIPLQRHNVNIGFSVRAPDIVISEYKIQETFPLRNYVFFEEGSSEFSDRYVTLTSSQAAAFREEQLQDALPSEPRGRSLRQMVVYHNLLNIIGDRMRRNPTVTITLNGMSMQGPTLGRERAESVKRYLMKVFGIDASRILTAGIEEPPEGHTSGPEELAQLRAGNQRVEIESQSPEMLVQIGEGDFMLKPVQLKGEAPGTDSVVFRAPGAEALMSWWLEITDDQGVMGRFGPYTGNRETLPAAMLLGEHSWKTYTAVLVGQMRDGDSVRKEASFHLSRKYEGIHLTTRFAILFDFDHATAVSSYQKFLAEIVTSQIPDSSTVYIRGRTDVVGLFDHNFKLSEGRAKSVESSLEASVSARGGHGVSYQSSWTGEDTTQAPFRNVFPEERSYNRTVIIDIIPY